MLVNFSINFCKVTEKKPYQKHFVDILCLCCGKMGFFPLKVIKTRVIGSFLLVIGDNFKEIVFHVKKYRYLCIKSSIR